MRITSIGIAFLIIFFPMKVSTIHAESGGIHVGGIKTGSIQTGSIQTGSIQTGSIQTGSIQTGSIQTGNIQTGNIQTGNIQTGNIQTGGIQTGGIQTGGVQTGGIQTGGIQTGGVQTGGIQTGGIQTGGIQTGNIRNGGIQTGDIKNGNGSNSNNSNNSTPSKDSPKETPSSPHTNSNNNGNSGSNSNQQGNSTPPQSNPPTSVNDPVQQKALNITGAFEGSGFGNIAGNFDGQGLSLGYLQWNIGQGTLQPLLQKMNKENPELTKKILGDQYDEFVKMLNGSKQDQMNWAKSINKNGKVTGLWKDKLVALATTSEFKQIQTDAMKYYVDKASSIVSQYNLKSERAYALALDIAVQNGGLKKVVIERVNKQIKGKNLSEKEIMTIIATEVANASNPKYKNDVLSRKMTIVNGKGTVHGKTYDLEKEYGLTDQPYIRPKKS